MKICISGPVASGKTYFLDKISDLQNTTVLSEPARKVAEMYHDMIVNDTSTFRYKVCEFQRQRESIVESLMDDGLILCDSGILDNLTFLLLQDKERFYKELEIVYRGYKNKTIKPYDYVFYFDIDLTSGMTDLLKNALNDPLRKATINVNDYQKHEIEFRNAFIEVSGYLKGINVVPITVKPEEKLFDKRNEFVSDSISQLQNIWNNKQSHPNKKGFIGGMIKWLINGTFKQISDVR